MDLRVKIASDALTLIGADGIQSFEDDTVEAMAANAMYDDVYESLLSSYNWSFAKTVLKLNQVDKEPFYGYKYVYRVGETILKVINLNNSMNANYKLRAGKEIHTSYPQVDVTALVKVPEDELPASVLLVLKYQLAAAFVPIITENDSSAQRYLALAQNQLHKAMLQDAQQQAGVYVTTSASTILMRG